MRIRKNTSSDLRHNYGVASNEQWVVSEGYSVFLTVLTQFLLPSHCGISKQQQKSNAWSEYSLVKIASGAVERRACDWIDFSSSLPCQRPMGFSAVIPDLYTKVGNPVKSLQGRQQRQEQPQRDCATATIKGFVKIPEPLWRGHGAATPSAGRPLPQIGPCGNLTHIQVCNHTRSQYDCLSEMYGAVGQPIVRLLPPTPLDGRATPLQVP